jgi:DNA-binding NarL/FixJ family response regulator
VVDKTNDWLDIASRSLTPRETEVVRLVSQGLANKVVATKLGVCEGTVKIHLHSIYRKLHVKNRSELILSMIAYRQKK